MRLELRLNSRTKSWVDVSVYDRRGFCGSLTLDPEAWDELIETASLHAGDRLVISTYLKGITPALEREAKK